MGHGMITVSALLAICEGNPFHVHVDIYLHKLICRNTCCLKSIVHISFPSISNYSLQFLIALHLKPQCWPGKGKYNSERKNIAVLFLIACILRIFVKCSKQWSNLVFHPFPLISFSFVEWFCFAVYCKHVYCIIVQQHGKKYVMIKKYV